MPWKLQWPLTRGPGQRVTNLPPSIARQEFDDVLSRLSWLEKDHAKWRGVVTGGLRKDPEKPEEGLPEAAGTAIASQPIHSRFRQMRGF